MSVPKSVIHICSYVPLNNKYEHSLFFNDADEQLSYFMNRVRKSFSGYTYLRKKWSIKVEADMTSAETWCYLYFWNDVNQRTYYYFINSVEYVNDHTVELFLEMDVIQTYLFDIDLKPSFIDRMHHDGIDNTVYYTDEQLELGDFTINNFFSTSILDTMCLCILSTINPNTTTIENKYDIKAQVIGGIFVGMGVYAAPISTAEELTAITDRLTALENLGIIDGIVSMWMYPKHMIELKEGESWTGGSTFRHVRANVDLTFSIPGTFGTVDGYTPRNTKLMYYPFNFLYASNGNGGAATYKFELFEDDAPTFRLQGSVSPEGGVRLIPEQYNQTDTTYVYLNTDEGLTIQGYPSCAWDADGYKIWLAQNQNQHLMTQATGQLKVAAGAVGMGIGAAGAIGGVLTLNSEAAVSGLNTAVNGLNTALDGAIQIANHVAAKKDAEIQPPQARGTFSSNLNLSHGHMHFTLYRKTVTKPYAEIIDKYFDMYGYRWGKYAQPKIHVREAYTYINTIGCQISGNFGNVDRVKICNIFDRGITFWDNTKTMFDYSQSNNILPPELQI